jgi:hypothetical protein
MSAALMMGHDFSSSVLWNVASHGGVRALADPEEVVLVH